MGGEGRSAVRGVRQPACQGVQPHLVQSLRSLQRCMVVPQSLEQDRACKRTNLVVGGGRSAWACAGGATRRRTKPPRPRARPPHTLS